MNIEELKKKLTSYKRKDIIFTPHAEIRAFGRQINLEEVKGNILNPTKLVYVKEQESNNLKQKNMNVIFLIRRHIAINMFLQ